MEKYIKILTALGLNLKESKIYLAGLVTGSAPASKIANVAKMNRVTGYDILEKLKRKGFVKSFVRQNIKFFTATDPKEIHQRFIDNIGILENFLPELQALNKNEKPEQEIEISIFETEKELKLFCQKEKILFSPETSNNLLNADQYCLLYFPKGKIKGLLIRDHEVTKTFKKHFQKNHRTSLLQPLEEKDLQTQLNKEEKKTDNLRLF